MQNAFTRFDRWGAFRAVFQIAAFGANVWSLIALLGSRTDRSTNRDSRRGPRRLLSAIRHPHVHAIGHPTGRLIGKRKGQDIDLETVLKAAADHGCMMELNAQPDRLDLDDVGATAAKAHGVRVVVNTDGHSVAELGQMEFGVYQARRGGLEADDVANTRTLTQFRKLLKR